MDPVDVGHFLNIIIFRLTYQLVALNEFLLKDRNSFPIALDLLKQVLLVSHFIFELRECYISLEAVHCTTSLVELFKILS